MIQWIISTKHFDADFWNPRWLSVSEVVLQILLLIAINQENDVGSWERLVYGMKKTYANTKIKTLPRINLDKIYHGIFGWNKIENIKPYWLFRKCLPKRDIILTELV